MPSPRLSGVDREIMDEVMATGAVTYVGDVKHAVHMAKEAAGDTDVLVHGAVTTQLALTAGRWTSCTSIWQGHPLFEDMPPEHIELELTRAFGGPGVQHLRYRVRHAG